MILKNIKIRREIRFSRFKAIGRNEPCNLAFTQPRTGAAHRYRCRCSTRRQRYGTKLWPRLSLMDKSERSPAIALLYGLIMLDFFCIPRADEPVDWLFYGKSMRVIGNSYVAYIRCIRLRSGLWIIVKFLVVTTARGSTREYRWINYEFVPSIQHLIIECEFLPFLRY